MKDLTENSLEEAILEIQKLAKARGEVINIKPTWVYFPVRDPLTGEFIRFECVPVTW